VLRSLAMWAAFVALLIFYLPVVGAVQAVVNLENGAAGGVRVSVCSCVCLCVCLCVCSCVFACVCFCVCL
jgi:hypothetical protein